MLRQFTYKFISMFLLIPFLAASTGLSVYIHKCSCEHRTIATLFVEHKCHEEQVSSCCSIDVETEIHFSDSDASCGCRTEHVTIKVNDLFNSSNPTILIEKLDFKTIYLLSNQNSNSSLFNLGFITNNNLYIPDDSPPIKPAGRVLINFLHQIKTPEFLS